MMKKMNIDYKSPRKVNSKDKYHYNLKSYRKNIGVNKISIIIPLYNEEYSVKNVINGIANHKDYEIIIVNDGSTDNSINKIKGLNIKNLRILEHKRNMGYGAALLSGLRYARGDVIITLDSDGQHNPKEIPKLIKPIINGSTDVVIGSRYLGKSNYKIPIYTLLGEFFIRIILIILFGQKVANNQSGFRAFHKKYIKLLNNMKYNGMAFTTEFLLIMCLNGLRIKEIPINLKSRVYGISKVNLIRILVSIISCILRYTIKRFFKIV